MTELERKMWELQQIQNELDVTKDMDNFMALSQRAQRILDWLDAMPHNIRV